MTLLATDRPANRSNTDQRTVLVDEGPGRGLILVPWRRRDTLAAHLRAASLDRQLAAGVAAESSRLLATRAALLTDRRHRSMLARHWTDLAARAQRPAQVYGPRIPVARSGVRAAEDQIRRLADVLRSDRPVSATAVAAARLLLTDGRSAVYDRRRGTSDALATALERVIATL